MPRCAGRKPNGEPCERIVRASERYCYAHDPSRAAERKRNASRAGKSKANREATDVERTRDQLQSIADLVLGKDVAPAYAAVAVQALNGKLRALEILRKWRETDDLEQRISQLEERIPNG